MAWAGQGTGRHLVGPGGVPQNRACLLPGAGLAGGRGRPSRSLSPDACCTDLPAPGGAGAGHSRGLDLNSSSCTK